MGIVTRVRRILLTPKSEWPVIAAEPDEGLKLFVTYVMPLAALPPICVFIGESLVGVKLESGVFRFPWLAGIGQAALTWGLTLVGILAIAGWISKLAPYFGGKESFTHGLKAAAYAATASALIGVLPVLPQLEPIVIYSAVYALYLLWLGLPVVMGTRPGTSIVHALAAVVFGVCLLWSFNFLAHYAFADAIAGSVRDITVE